MVISFTIKTGKLLERLGFSGIAALEPEELVSLELIDGDVHFVVNSDNERAVAYASDVADSINHTE
jgi:hypothetical protein